MPPRRDLPAHRPRLAHSERSLLDELRSEHHAVTDRGRDTPFQILDGRAPGGAGRRYAVCEYGARCYDGGLEVLMAVELSAGGVAHFSIHSAWAMCHPRTRALFFAPELAADDDPVRACLAARAFGPIGACEAYSDEWERWASLHLVRADHPGLIPPLPPWPADEPPSAYLFGRLVPGRFARSA